MNTLESIKARKSQRSYEQKLVEEEKIEQLIFAANSAPKAGILHLSVVENYNILKALNDETLIAMKNSGNDLLVSRASLEGYQPLYGAPVLILFSGKEGALYIDANASCAATNVTIAATELGLGSCYVISPLLGIRANPELGKKIGIPEGFIPICGVLIGYASGNAFESPRSIANTINYCK